MSTENKIYAELAYENRPCNFKDSDDQTIEEFAENLAMYAGYTPNPDLVGEIVLLIKRVEDL